MAKLRKVLRKTSMQRSKYLKLCKVWDIGQYHPRSYVVQSAYAILLPPFKIPRINLKTTFLQTSAFFQNHSIGLQDINGMLEYIAIIFNSLKRVETYMWRTCWIHQTSQWFSMIFWGYFALAPLIGPHVVFSIENIPQKEFHEVRVSPE